MQRERLIELYSCDFESGLLVSRRIGRPVGSKGKVGYLIVSVDGKKLYVHRVLYFMKHGTLPRLVDHQDGDKTNNRISNLRALTHKQNSLNRRDVRGVYFNKSRGKWVAQISNKNLGLYPTEAEAAAVRKAALEAEFKPQTM